MTDAARLANLKAAIHELYKARFERCYALIETVADRDNDDILTALFDADARYCALTMSIATLREQAAEVEEQLAAVAAVRASVEARRAA